MSLHTSKQSSNSALDAEVRILRLIQNGLPIKEIAYRTDLSTDEVSSIIGELVDKLLTAKMAQQFRQVAVTRSSPLSRCADPKSQIEEQSREDQDKNSV